ncbi:MAG: D-alanyl-D-alanine carboxypeptidase family protein, partial [Alphaproteobacteria bacterium]
ACIVAAEGMAGDEEVFAALMTQKAKELGLKNTTFKNATGLPHPEHLMSSHDLALLAKALIQNFPEYYPIYSEKEFTYNNIKQGNRNPLLYTMDGADGLKTGHTQASGFGLTGSVKTQDGRRLIMVINGLKSMKERSSEAQKLMGYGLSAFENVLVFHKDKPIEDIPVWYGDAETVPAVLNQDLVLTVARGEQTGVVSKIIYDTPIVAPIQKGQTIGQVMVTTPNNQIKTVDLVAAKDIAPVGYFGKIKKILSGWFGL